MEEMRRPFSLRPQTEEKKRAHNAGLPRHRPPDAADSGRLREVARQVRKILIESGEQKGAERGQFPASGSGGTAAGLPRQAESEQTCDNRSQSDSARRSQPGAVPKTITPTRNGKTSAD